MTYFKIILTFICFFIVQNYSLAFCSTEWKQVKITDTKINQLLVDVKSINIHNDSVYYAVLYFTNSNNGRVAIIQSKGREAGIVETYSYNKYEDIMQTEESYPPKTPKTATKFFTISPTSKLYEANEKAMQIIKQSIPELNMQTNTPSNNVSENNFTKDGIDFKPYMKKLQRNIKRNWHPPKGNESKRVVLLFKIAKDGKLLSNSVYKTSGIPTVDRAALNAVEMTAPFRPLPAEFRGESVDIQFTFDYNVFGAEN